MAASKIISARGYGSVTLNTLGCDRLVVASVGYGVSTFTDAENGSGWQALTAQQDSGGSRLQLYYHESPSVDASHLFTHPQGYGALAVIGFTGWAASSAFDGENGAVLVSNALTMQPGSLTPSEDGCVVIAVMGSGGDPSGSTPAGFTYDASTLLAGVGGTNYGIALAWKIQGTAGAENPTFSHTPTGLGAAVIAAFKSDGIGGGGGGLAMPPRRAFPMSILNH